MKTWIKNIFKKNKTEMLTEEKLISYKQNFTGQQFQWIKTDRPELIGKVVKCRDVRPDGIVIFDDGSMIQANLLNSNLMMIHGDMQPLSKDEVARISPPPVQKKVTLTPPEPVTEAVQTTSPAPAAQPVQSAPVQDKNPFEMFDSDEIDLSLKLKVKMPDKKLLKLMYNNAADKEVFLDQLSNYVTSMINNTVVSESLRLMLDPKSTTSKSVKPTDEVKLTEVSNDKQ